MELVQVGDGAGDQAVEGENQDDGADDAVDEPHRADIEVSAHLIDKEGDDAPPQQCPHDDKRIADNHVVELELRQGETETCEQWDDEEHDERVAQGEQESRDHVPPLIVALVDIFLDLAYWVVNDHVNGIDNQDNATHNLQDIDVVGNEIGHQ